MKDFLNKEVVSFDTSRVGGTLAIGASFIFIAYFLHPAVESAYQRVRAYRAWRAIEMRQTVEVTNYPMLAETLGGRGKWDTARIITVLLAVFSLVSWGLELSMDLAYHSGDADILNRSPPISSEQVGNGTITWKVIPEESFDFQRDWNSLSNVDEDSATSKYNINNTDTCRTGYVDGNIVVASWSRSPESKHAQLHYLRGDSNTTVTGLECADTAPPEHMNISNGDVHWGSGVQCETGPALVAYNKTDTPPTLILNKNNEKVYLIVEESSNYPSFLYSVWTAATNLGGGDSIELNHEFHIAATVRLAEAVVTGIVHDQISGKYCFELVRMYSESRNQSDSELTRAEPFGEHPTNDSVRIEDVEKIECGLEVDLKAVICFVCLMVLTSVGIAWSLCLRSSIGMDVYDRDELIRAVSMSRGAASSCNNDAPSAIRIFVRKEDTGSMSVAVSETGDSEYSCARMFRSGGKVVEDDIPSPSVATSTTINQYNEGYGGAAIPVGSRTVWLEGVRTGMGRAFPGRNGNFRYPTSVALIASPVPSNACSSIPSNACSLVATPLRSPSPLPGGAPRGEAPARTGGGRGASILFDLTYSSSDSGENERDDSLPAGGSDDIEGGGGTPIGCVAALGDHGGASASSLKGVHALDMGGRRRGWVDCSVGKGVLRFSSGRTTPESEQGSTPEPPPFLQRREHTFGPPPQLDPLAQDSRREIIGFSSSFEEVNGGKQPRFSAL